MLDNLNTPSSILLVEDNASDEEMTRRALKRSTVIRDVAVCRDGEEAIRYLSAPNVEPPSLVLLDLKLPKVGGLEVLETIRDTDRTKRCPVVVFTSSREHADVLGCFECGANSFIQKPMDYDQYMDIIAKTVDYWLTVNVPCG